MLNVDHHRCFRMLSVHVFQSFYVHILSVSWSLWWRLDFWYVITMVSNPMFFVSGPGMVRNFRNSSRTQRSILLQWTTPLATKTKILFYYVRVLTTNSNTAIQYTLYKHNAMNGYWIHWLDDSQIVLFQYCHNLHVSS